ncbi:MAG: hypothetical protein ABSC04_20080 [Syntrophobacteraceae bacterium]|jgi:hypothetical protein
MTKLEYDSCAGIVNSVRSPGRFLDLLYEFAFKIELIEKSGEVTSPGPPSPCKIWPRAQTRAAKRSAPAAVAQHLLGGRRSAILK